MQNHRAFLLMLTALGAFGAWLQTRAPAAAPAPVARAEDHGYSADAEAKWMGVASCASTACHHEGGPKGAKHSEYSTWAGFDKHARAFQVLYNERSTRIAKNFPDADGKFRAATEHTICLRCHASHNGDTAHHADERFSLADGVGCESCHGAAGNWINEHYRAGFKEKSLDAKAALGLRPTKDLSHRAKLCSECHVGNAEKEVNHDLIAAGHPRLSFEFSAYSAIYNKHWSPREDRARYPDFEASAWRIGQVTVARAAIDLLATRAQSAGADQHARPWPEFSEYDCFACHKDLQVDSARFIKGYGKRKPGAFPYGSWYLTLTEALARQRGGEFPSLAKLKEAMQSPAPDARKAGALATQASADLNDWLEQMTDTAATESVESLDRLLSGLIRDGSQRADTMSWDEATQFYLAIVALQAGRTELGGVGADLRKPLLPLARRLRSAYPPGIDSPRDFNPAKEPTLKQQIDKFSSQLGK